MQKLWFISRYPPNIHEFYLDERPRRLFMRINDFSGWLKLTQRRRVKLPQRHSNSNLLTEIKMPIYKFACNQCGKIFDKILPSSDISSVTCSACRSPEISRVFASGSVTKCATNIPAGALSGGFCKSGFS